MREQRDNSGALFKNKNKKTDKHPDMTGKGMVYGQEVEISAWSKTDRNGNTFFSISFREPRNSVEHTHNEPVRYGDDAGDYPF